MSENIDHSAIVLATLQRVKVLLCDVDGVLTDGTVSIGQGGECKSFSIQDGLGMRLLQKSGIPVGWISNRPSTATRQRAQELKIDFLYQESGGKVAAVDRILMQAGLTWEEVCYIGDDVVDLAVLKRVGAPVVVANAIAEAKTLACHVTQHSGGHGAVREVAEMILKAQKKWSGLIMEYLA